MGAFEERRRWHPLSPTEGRGGSHSPVQTSPFPVLKGRGGGGLQCCAKACPSVFIQISYKALWRPDQSGDKWLFNKAGRGRQAIGRIMLDLMNFYKFV